METTTQQQFDAFVAQHGAPAVVDAIKGHIHPNDGNGCKSGCAQGYICVDGQCKLDIGGGL